MSAALRIPRKMARRILLRLERCRFGDGQSMADEEWLRRALAPSTKRTRARAAARALKGEKRATKAERRRDVREAVAARADGRCECGCGRWFTEINPMHMDHFWGKARAESLETCWGITATCHHEKHHTEDRRVWLQLFARHASRYGYPLQVIKAESELASLADVAAAGVVSGSGRP